jgi:hypothetical protein
MFPWPDRKLVIVHLASFDWDFSLGRAVKLVQGPTEIEAKQIGSGNHEDHATVTLILVGDWDAMMPVLQKMRASGQPISIEFG